MSTLHLSIYNKKYLARAAPKRQLETDEKELARKRTTQCYTCRRPFRLGDAIAVSRNTFVVRRHVECAIEKGLLSKKEAKLQLGRVFKKYAH